MPATVVAAPPPLSEALPRFRVESTMLDAFSAALGLERARRPEEHITPSSFLRTLIWRGLASYGFGPAKRAA